MLDEPADFRYLLRTHDPPRLNGRSASKGEPNGFQTRRDSAFVRPGVFHGGCGVGAGRGPPEASEAGWTRDHGAGPQRRLSPLRDIAPIPPRFQDNEEHPVKKLPHRHPFPRLGSKADPVLQSLAPVPLVSTTAGLSFDGVGVPNYGVASAPPDTVGAIGATQYVQWVNTAFAVFDKATGAMVFGPANGNTLWAGFGGRCETDNDGDPIVVYDQAADRWVMTQFSVR